MSTYLEHPSRTSRWEDGTFVVLEDALYEDCTVWFAFDRTAAGDVRWEGLLGRRLAQDRVRICAIPLFVDGVNLGDEVSTVESGEGATVAVEVVAGSGNETFRVRFAPAGADGQNDLWQRLMIELEPFGCWFDVYRPDHVAVSVEPRHAQDVAQYLARRERRGELRSESGVPTDGAQPP